MTSVRVVHVIGGGDTGGAMTHLLSLLPALLEQGCEAHLLCLGDGGLAAQARERGLPLQVLPMAGARDPRVFGPLREVLAAGWAVVHTHGMRAHVPTRIVLGTMRRRPCLAATVHSDLRLDYPPGLARVYELFDRATLGMVDAIVCVSAALRDCLVERGYPRERLVVVHSGLEAERLRVLNELSVDLLGVPSTEQGGFLESGASDFGASAGADDSPRDDVARPLRVGTVARLVKAKDLDLFVDVVGRVRHAHPRVEGLIAGDGPERSRLENLVREKGLEGAVRLVGRVDQVEEFLRHLDVYLVTSVFEGGVSMAVLEAMAAGLPVVATRAGGVAEAIVEGETGFLVSREAGGATPPGAGEEDCRARLADSLAVRVCSLLERPTLRRRMGLAAVARVREHFTAERAAAMTVRLYERCLAARTAGRPKGRRPL